MHCAIHHFPPLVTHLACGQAAASAARKIDAKMEAVKLKLEADQRQLEKQQRKAKRRERRERRAQRKAAPATMATMAMAALAASVVAVEDSDGREEEAADYIPARSRLLTNYALSPGWGGDGALVDGGVESTHPLVRLASVSPERGSTPHASPNALQGRRASSRDSCSSAGDVEGLPTGGESPEGEQLLATADRASSPELQSPFSQTGSPQAWYQQVPLSAPDPRAERWIKQQMDDRWTKRQVDQTTDEARGRGVVESAWAEEQDWFEAAESDEVERLHARHVNFGGAANKRFDADADSAKGPGGGATGGPLTLWDLLDENTSLQRRMRRRASMATRPPWQCPSLAPVFSQGALAGSGRLDTPRGRGRATGRAQLLPQLFELTAYKVADATAFDHPGARTAASSDCGAATRHSPVC